MTKSIVNVEEFITWTKNLQGEWILFRGLADANWDVESSAFRRIRKSLGISSEMVPMVSFLNYIDQVLDDAGLQGFRERQDRGLSDLELLADLQHYGAATCLIDFTANALIALWFACNEEPGQAGKVVAMPTDDIDRFSTVTYGDLDRPVNEFLNQGKLWKWEPSGRNNHIVAQQSVRIFGVGRIEEDYYTEIRIAADHKREILETLNSSFGINVLKLFNDRVGFARTNAHDQPYERLSAEEYFLSLIHI